MRDLVGPPPTCCDDPRLPCPPGTHPCFFHARYSRSRVTSSRQQRRPSRRASSLACSLACLLLACPMASSSSPSSSAPLRWLLRPSAVHMARVYRESERASLALRRPRRRWAMWTISARRWTTSSPSLVHAARQGANLFPRRPIVIIDFFALSFRRIAPYAPILARRES